MDEQKLPQDETKSQELNPTDNAEAKKNDKTTPLRCFVASLISGGIASLLYLLMNSIVQTYSTKVVTSANPLVIKITIAVRTLVIGIAALGTGVFGFVAVGLFLLGIQVTIKDLTKRINSKNA